VEQAEGLIALSRERGLTLACAPATFLGPAQQTARRLMDAGELGQVLGASTTLVYPGPDQWHHDPAALFGPAAGPVFDMGVYDVTALVNLFGPVARVSAAGGSARSQRAVGTGPPRRPDLSRGGFQRTPRSCSASIPGRLPRSP
jgi:predicted dehydrogenase